MSVTDSKTEISALDRAIAAATDALLARQRPDGHWVFELEADATIPAEYVLLRHYLGEPVDAALEAKIAVYLRRIQGAHGGWPLFKDGGLDVRATVRAYFALKMIGDDPQAAHMTRAREGRAQEGRTLQRVPEIIDGHTRGRPCEARRSVRGVRARLAGPGACGC